MATTVTYNNNNYSIPAYGDTGYAQGAGNLSSYLIALATGSLNVSGGAFTLTADVNFGGNFGLVALYLKSVTLNVASAGFLRLANTDSIQWRNGLNNGNDILSVDTNDRLDYNSNAVVVAGNALPANSAIVFTTPDGTKTFQWGINNNGDWVKTRLT